MGHHYSLHVFGNLIADEVRTRAYRDALARSITPESVVLDIGTGTGIFACLAAQLGARKVYALEPNDVIEVARAVAARNACLERITFIQEMSTAVTLPEPADVIVSDIRGVLPLFEHHLPSIVDARTRLLKPGGALIPQMDVLWGAIVEAPTLYARQAKPWEDRPYGVDMSVVKQFTMNSWFNARIASDQLLTRPCRWAALDYRTLEQPDVRGGLAWTAERRGTAHGFCLCFETTLVEGIGYSSGPVAGSALIYGSAFFPFASPFAVNAGDHVSIDADARWGGDEYLWRWSTSVQRAGADTPEISLRQSTFLGTPWAPARLRKRAPSAVPALGEEGQIERFILERIDGHTSIEQIARVLYARFPQQFQSADQAVGRVADAAARYSRPDAPALADVLR